MVSEQIDTWCEQPSFEKVGKRDAGCLSWFEATSWVSNVVNLPSREGSDRIWKQGWAKGDGTVPCPLSP